jgi:hypothetical protein
MEPEQADPEKLGFNPFDVTKVWPKDLFQIRISLLPDILPLTGLTQKHSFVSLEY